ncbi:methyltransferase domain-containing protein [Paucibacter sp. O1-1]|nr:methyltransferase domain-containing protein [Paucibacter sp. O1-1]MDA3829986.1 methyltransferase domain-containing protein [Paucibacter sp. O1-1]
MDYDTTDVRGVGECLPFVDGAFDAVISIAVLEHVRDPFRCAAELVRVLKPGGELICCVPFLQPYHGYPHHYYNMTHQGLRALFERDLTVDSVEVIDSTGPVWALTWILQSWAQGLEGKARGIS